MSSASSTLLQQLQALLSQLFPDVADTDVLEYLAAGLAEQDVEEIDAEELADSLAGFSPAFGALPPAHHQAQVADLLRNVAAMKAEVDGAAPTTTHGRTAGVPDGAQAAGTAPKPALAAVVAETLSRLGSLSVGSASAGAGASASAAPSECGSEDEGLGSPHWTEEQQAAVCMLRELCALPPDIGDAFLAHLLGVRGGGDIQAAASWMLECPDLAAAQLAWQQARRRRREERARAAAERDAAKRQIVSRFQLQAVPNGSAVGKAKPEPLKAWGEDKRDGKCGGGGGDGKVRYRDGVVATRAGQKYVIEKGEEWDGGSRGKVYTKGKRGKGFA